MRSWRSGKAAHIRAKSIFYRNLMRKVSFNAEKYVNFKSKRIFISPVGLFIAGAGEFRECRFGGAFYRAALPEMGRGIGRCGCGIGGDFSEIAV